MAPPVTPHLFLKKYPAEPSGTSIFLDSNHVNKKIKDRIGWAGKKLIGELHKALRKHDWDEVSTVLYTVLSKAQCKH